MSVITESLARGVIRQDVRSKFEQADKVADRLIPSESQRRTTQYKATQRNLRKIAGDEFLYGAETGTGKRRAWHGFMFSAARNDLFALHIASVPFRNPENVTVCVMPFVVNIHAVARLMQGFGELDLSPVREALIRHIILAKHSCMEPTSITHTLHESPRGGELVIWRPCARQDVICDPRIRLQEAVTVIPLARLDGPNLRLYERARAGLRDEGVLYSSGDLFEGAVQITQAMLGRRSA